MIVLALVFLSGASALIYQVLLIKYSVVVFGATVDAVSAVTACFIAGLSAGSYVAGKWADRSRSPLWDYGLVEGAVGILCAGFPWYFEGATSLYVPLARFAPGEFAYLTALRLLLSGMIIGLPTMLMGASLPLVCRFALRSRERAGQGFSSIYGVNTLGAAVGTVASTYWMLPRWGLPTTLGIAVGLNLLVSGSALALSQRRRFAEIAATALSDGASRPTHFSATCLAFLSGYLVFSLEVLFAHLLQLTVGGSEYVVGAILSGVLVSLGCASWCFGRVAGRVGATPALGAMILTLAGAVLIFHLPLWNQIPEIFPMVGLFHPGFAAREFIRFGVSVAAIFLPCFFAGALFPYCVARVLAESEGVGLPIGRLYAVNSIGALLGSLTTGFILLPWIGSLHAIRLFSAVYLILALGHLVFHRKSVTRRFKFAISAIAACGLAGIGSFSRWDLRPLTGGANVYFTSGFSEYDKLLFFSESVHGGVTTVIQKGDVKVLLTNGKFQGASGGEVVFQKNMALVPMVMSRKFNRALNIGFGTGQTAATLAAGPYQQIDIAEISKDIVDAAEREFPDLHRGVLRDPRVHLNLVDGRNFLLLKPDASYDVITVQVGSIWIAGAASLYNREFYELCKRRLTSGGILQQWLQLHHMRWQEQMMVIQTLSSVFPYVSIWGFGHQAVLLASTEPLTADYATLTSLGKRFKERNEFEVFSHHLLSNDRLRQFLVDAVGSEGKDSISTDAHPRLAFETPKGVTETDSASRFYRRIQPYRITRLKELIGGIPDDRIEAEIRTIIIRGSLAGTVEAIRD